MASQLKRKALIELFYFADRPRMAGVYHDDTAAVALGHEELRQALADAQ